MAAWVAGAALSVGMLGVAAGAAAQQSQYPIFTAETFVATMKTIGQNYAGTTAAIAQGDYESAKARAIRAREQLATTVTLWRKNKKDDAVKMLQAAKVRFDELDGVLSKTPVDKDAAAAVAKQIGEACQACHARYRERDPATNAFRFTADALK